MASADGYGTSFIHDCLFFCDWLGVRREVWDRIGDMISKTLIAAQPSLQSVYRSCVSADDDGFTCFEVLGFDIMLDSKLRPWLIEVNHSPSFTCDTPFDLKIKSTLVREQLNYTSVWLSVVSNIA